MTRSVLGKGACPPAALGGMASVQLRFTPKEQDAFNERMAVKLAVQAANMREVGRRADQLRPGGKPLTARASLMCASRQLEGLEASTSGMLRQSALDAAAYALLALEALDAQTEPDR